MELFQNFDDDVFTESRTRDSETRLISYNAKFCEKEWFISKTISTLDDVDEKLQVLKFRAELHYFRREYLEALTNFDAALDLVKPHNLPLRRDIDESRCRTLIALNRPTDALHVALHLHKKSQNYDQKGNTLALLVKCYEKLNLPLAAILCIQRLLALHPLNPEYWIQFAKLAGQTLGSTSGTSVEKSPDKSSKSSSTLTTTNVHERLSSAPISRLPLYNPDYPCRMCVLENCTSCCIYRHQISEIRTRTECCSECPKQDLAPEVHFLTMDCTCWENPEGELISLLDVVRKSKISHGGCTVLLQTPHQTHSHIRCNQSTQTADKNEPNKHLGCDINELCEKLNDGILDDKETVKTAEGHMDVNGRKAICIALVRARYLLKNIEMNLVSFPKERYRSVSATVEERLRVMSLTANEKTFYEKWTSSDFGLDSQGKCRASSPFDETRTEAVKKPETHLFKKSEEVVDASDFDVNMWFLGKWLKTPSNLQHTFSGDTKY